MRAKWFFADRRAAASEQIANYAMHKGADKAKPASASSEWQFEDAILGYDNLTMISHSRLGETLESAAEDSPPKTRERAGSV